MLGDLTAALAELLLPLAVFFLVIAAAIAVARGRPLELLLRAFPPVLSLSVGRADRRDGNPAEPPAATDADEPAPGELVRLHTRRATPEASREAAA